MKVNQKLLKQARKLRAKTKQAELKVKANKVLTKASKTGAEANVAKTNEAKTSSNPFKRRLSQWREENIAKHEAKMDAIKAKGELAKLKPELAAQQQRAENAVKIHKAKGHAKIASTTAIASGMAKLGQGLSDEQNQDDAKQREADKEIASILGGKGDSGLVQGDM